MHYFKNLILQLVLVLSFVMTVSDCYADSQFIEVIAGDEQALIAAIIKANSHDGTYDIKIKDNPDGNNEFVFTQPYENSQNALPVITGSYLITTEVKVAFRRAEDASFEFRFIEVASGNLVFVGGIIRDFSVSGNGGAVKLTGSSNTVFYNTDFRHNNSSGAGGALSSENDSVLKLVFVKVTNNHAQGNGGGVNVQDGGLFYSNGTSYSDNSVNGFGDALNMNSSHQTKSLLIGSQFSNGGAGTVAIHDPMGRLQLRSCTLVGDGLGIMTTDETYVLGNIFRSTSFKSTSPHKLACEDFETNTIISEGYNISTDSSCRLDQLTDLPDTDPMLGSADDNGVYPLLAGSPAIEAGPINLRTEDNAYVSPPCNYRDIRGLGRPQDANLDGIYECDIGAYEVQGGADKGQNS